VFRSVVRHVFQATATRVADGWVVEVDTGFDEVTRMVHSKHRSTVRQAAESLAAETFLVPVGEVQLVMEWIK
jgi:hypothetical protein